MDGSPMQRTHWSRRPDLWAGVLILGTTLARLAFAASGQLDLVQDEAQYWDWSRTFQFSYFTKGPLIAWMIGAWTWLLGDSVFAVRLGAVLGTALMQATVYLGLSRLFGRPRLGLLCLVVLNTTLLFLAAGTLMTTDNPLLVCWWAALFALYAAGATPGRAGPSWSWPRPGVGTWGKDMMLASPSPPCFTARCMRRADARLVPVLAAAGPGPGGRHRARFGPILLWNLGNDFAGFRHVAHLGGLTGVARSPSSASTASRNITAASSVCSCLGGSSWPSVGPGGLPAAAAAGAGRCARSRPWTTPSAPCWWRGSGRCGASSPCGAFIPRSTPTGPP
jgi:hypothetical protein